MILGTNKKIKNNESFFKNVKGFYKSFLAENIRVFEYYVRILALKLGDKSNMIWDALYKDLKTFLNCPRTFKSCEFTKFLIMIQFSL